MTDPSVTTLTVRFANRIRQEELPFLRGAVIRALGDDTVLGHNHIGDGLRYAYPLIQYKRIDGCAALVGIGDGVEQVERFMAVNPPVMHIGHRSEPFLIASAVKGETLLRLTPDMHCYALEGYLPFNQTNYEQYQRLDGMVERCALIERCLVGNVLSFAKGVGVFFDGQVRVALQSVEHERLYPFKNIRMMGFDIVFKANVTLPPFVGLGKKVSFGYGTLMPSGNNGK